MATAATIRQELEQINASIEQENQTQMQLSQELDEATERQRLRREVDAAKESLAIVRGQNSAFRWSRANVDNDAGGIHKPNAQNPGPQDQGRKQTLNVREGRHSQTKMEANCKKAVSTATMEWKITGMSWLKEALDQTGDSYAWTTQTVSVGSSNFEGRYCPWPLEDIWTAKHEQGHATLGVSVDVDFSQCDNHQKSVIRHRFYIMRQDGQYAQWGQEGQVCERNEDLQDLLLGPDVTSTSQAASGIFGLQHDELLQSEWVNNDTLTVKVELEVRPFTGEWLPTKPSIEVPEATISSKFLSWFQEERCTDVTFNVKGESIKAHSQVLAARSEVFQRQFFGGLQESVSKEVVIEDMEPKIFKGFLKFLYTDDLEHIEATIKECLEENNISSDSTGSTGSVPSITKASILQDILAMSHKYQELRLLAWCQQQLCTYITEREVCSVLCQAHLCEAQQLETECLVYIKEHFSKIAPTEEFARLTTEWPELMLKISLHAQGVSSEETAAALSTQQAVRKRKREAS